MLLDSLTSEYSAHTMPNTNVSVFDAAFPGTLPVSPNNSLRASRISFASRDLEIESRLRGSRNPDGTCTSMRNPATILV